MEWINFIFQSSAQQMVIVSITSLLAVMLGMMGYRNIWPKKRLNPGWVVLVLALPPLVSVLRPGSYESGDLSINVIKAMSFYDNLAEGNLIPRWAGDLNAHYGYPAHLFAYPLPYYLASGVYALNFSAIAGVKAVLVISYLLSGFGMYRWLKEEVSPWPAFLGAILYLYAPYHLVDLHFRVAIGELTAMAFIPLTLWTVACFAKTGKRWVWLGISGFWGLTILSHQALALLFLPFLLVYGGYRCKKSWGWFGAAVILGIMLSAFYWLPIITEGRFTHQALYAAAVWFPPWLQFIYSPWRWGFLFQGPKGELSYIIGYIQLIMVLMGLGLLILGKKVKQRMFLAILVGFTLIYTLMMFKVTEPVWNLLDILKNLQFSYRFLGVIILLIGAMGAVVAENVRPKRRTIFIAGTAGLAIMVTILNWGNRRNLPNINDNYLLSVLPGSTARGEGLHPATPRWTDPTNPWQAILPKEPITILGIGKAKEIVRQNTYRKYEINLPESSKIVIHTLYFPGWKAWVNNVPMDLKVEEISDKGEMGLTLAAGKQVLELKFEDTYIRRVGMILSIISLLVIIGIFTGSGGGRNEYALKR